MHMYTQLDSWSLGDSKIYNWVSKTNTWLYISKQSYEFLDNFLDKSKKEGHHRPSSA
jgi:hypothetical protein